MTTDFVHSYAVTISKGHSGSGTYAYYNGNNQVAMTRPFTVIVFYVTATVVFVFPTHSLLLLCEQPYVVCITIAGFICNGLDNSYQMRCHRITSDFDQLIKDVSNDY